MTQILILFYFIGFLCIWNYIILWPIVLICRILSFKRTIAERIYGRIVMFHSFLTIARPISAIKSLNPFSEELTVFRNYKYKNKKNFLVYYTILLILLSIVIVFSSIRGYYVASLIFLLAYIYWNQYPILNYILLHEQNIKKANEIFNHLDEDDLNNIKTLKNLVIIEYSSLSYELMEFNKKVLSRIKMLISDDQHFLINNLNEFQEKLFRRHNYWTRFNLMKPKLILLNSRYGNEIKKVFEESLNEIKK